MAFTACHLRSVIIPATLHYVPSMAFAGNRGIEHVILHDDNPYLIYSIVIISIDDSSNYFFFTTNRYV